MSNSTIIQNMPIKIYHIMVLKTRLEGLKAQSLELLDLHLPP